MTDWPFYFALIILLCLINIKVKETMYESDLINNIEKTINYGESKFDVQNNSLADQIKNTSNQRDATILEDRNVRAQNDNYTGNQPLLQKNYNDAVSNYNNCDMNLKAITTKTLDCSTYVATKNSQVVQDNVDTQYVQEKLKECNTILQYGYPPPLPPNKPPPNPAAEAVNKAVNNIVKSQPEYDYYDTEYKKCVVDLNKAKAGYAQRHPPPPPRRGCVIL